MPYDISPAVALLLDYSPKFAYADFSLIRMWMDEGADMEKDIVPAMRQCMDRRKDIKSLSYFTAQVRKARDMRLDTENVIRSRQACEPDAERRKARMVAKTLRVYKVADPTQERWLEAYEAKNGMVEV